jgi:hypothetical protein
MNSVHKIAVFGKDVYILYVVELVHDCIFLLFFYTFGEPEIFKYIVSNMHFSGSGGCGKKSTLSRSRKRPQYIVLPPSFTS